MDDRAKQNIARVSNFKTRKAEIISGLTVAGAIACYGALRAIYSDITALIETKTRITEDRIARVESAFKDIIILERTERKEGDQELKQRVIWIEREIGTFRKK